MSHKLKNLIVSIDRVASIRNVNEFIFMGLVVLCFIGDVMGEISDHAVIMYWLLMTPIFFLGSIIIEKSYELKSSIPRDSTMRNSLILWGSAFFSVLIILFLWHAESFAAGTVGVIIHVILGHTLFISGIFLGFWFYLIGLFLLFLAWLTIAMEGTVGMTLMLAIPLLIIGLNYRNKFSLGFR
ncbi:MAG: hypothetical protein L3J59_12790 [Methylococcaceae bacterium]|nr:hypothetical protein [Methylococcaceae bacterium]